jgi:chromosome segregation ATPase
MSKAKGKAPKATEHSTPVKANSKTSLSDHAQHPDTHHPEVSPAEALEAEIKSKQRILALLDRRLEGDAALQEQIVVRDRRIEEITARIVATEAKAKVRNEASVAKLKEQNAKLTHELQSAQVVKARNEDTIAKLRTELATLKATYEDEKEAAELLSEALTEETEAAKAELEQKKGQVIEVKKDIAQLSKIIQDMTKLNAELNDKIDAINRDTARMSADYYAAVARAEHTEQLEKDLAEYISSSQRYEKQVARLNETLDKSYRGKLALEQASREAQASLQHLSGLLDEASLSNDPRIAQSSVQVVEGLKKVRHLLKQSTPDEVSRPPQELEEPAQQQAQLRELRTLLKDKERQQGKDQVELGNLTRKLGRIEAQHGKELADNKDALDRVQKRANALLEQVTGFSDRLELLRNDFGKKEGDLQRTQTQVLHLQARVEDMKRKVGEHMEKSSTLEKMMKDQRASILKTQTERFEEEKQLALKERKVLKAMAGLQALKEELYLKETELQKKTKEILVLGQQVAEQDAKLKAVQARLKSASKEGVEEYVQKLEDKNREIEILKEMIRGAQTEVKQKESLITRFKKRPEDKVPTMRSSRTPPLARRIEEFVEEVEAGASLKKPAQSKLVAKALEKLCKGLDQDQVVSVRSLRDHVTSEKFRSLLAEDGEVQVSSLVSSLRGWFN